MQEHYNHNPRTPPFATSHVVVFFQKARNPNLPTKQRNERHSRLPATTLYNISLSRCSRQTRLLSVSSTISTISKSSWPRPLPKPEADAVAGAETGSEAGSEAGAGAGAEAGAETGAEAAAKEAWSAAPPSIAANLSRAFVEPAVSFASAPCSSFGEYTGLSTDGGMPKEAVDSTGFLVSLEVTGIG